MGPESRAIALAVLAAAAACGGPSAGPPASDARPDDGAHDGNADRDAPDAETEDSAIDAADGELPDADDATLDGDGDLDAAPRTLAPPYLAWTAPTSPPDGGPASGGPYAQLTPHTVATLVPPFVGTRVDGSMAYNHAPLLARWRSEYVVMFDTHDFREEGPGGYLRWSRSVDGAGASWTPPATLFEPQQAQRDAYDVVGRVFLPGAFVEVSERLFAIGVVEDRVYDLAPPLPFSTRIPVGLMAREVFATDPAWTLGPAVWLTGPVEPLPGFPSYEHDDSLGAELLARLDLPGSRPPWSYWHGAGELYPEIFLADGTRLCERDEVALAGGQWLRTWRDCREGTAGPALRFLFAQVSADGHRWDTPRATGVPDAPAKTILLGLRDGHVLLVGNPHAASGAHARDVLYLAKSDTRVDAHDGVLTFSAVYSVTGAHEGYGIASYPDALESDDGSVAVVFSTAWSGIHFTIVRPP